MTLAMAKAELVPWSMQTRDLKVGQGRHQGSADFQECLTVLVAVASCDPEDRLGTDRTQMETSR